MSEGLTNIEQEFIKTSDARRLMLLSADTSVRLLANEIRREEKGDEPSPHATAIRASLATDAIEKVEKAKALLADLSQKLTALQQEQLKSL